MVEHLVTALRSALPGPVDIAVVLGSGLGSFADTCHILGSVSTAELPGYPASTVPGHAGRILRAECEGISLLLFQGRIHGYEGNAVTQTVLPATLAAALGAQTLIVTNAAGGIHPRMQAGDLMLIEDLLTTPMAQGMGLALNAFHEIDPEQVRLAMRRFDDVRHRNLRQAILRRAWEQGIPLRQGCYGFVSGPSYETRAEVGFLRRLGVDVVGMSSVPEILAGLAVGLRVVGLSCVTNKASTLATAVTHEEVQAVARVVSGRFSALIRAIFPLCIGESTVS